MGRSHFKSFLSLAAAGVCFSLASTIPTASWAVVYCKTAGVPQGCVQRPIRVVYCTRPGYPAGCVAKGNGTGVGVMPGAGAGAAGVGLAPGPGLAGDGVNTGGPVNRAGVR
jgi:hypothetical protein